jgi:hypothetical protein
VGGCEDKSSLSRSGKEARGGGMVGGEKGEGRREKGEGRREKGEGRSGSV